MTKKVEEAVGVSNAERRDALDREKEGGYYSKVKSKRIAQRADNKATVRKLEKHDAERLKDPTTKPEAKKAYRFNRRHNANNEVKRDAEVSVAKAVKKLVHKEETIHEADESLFKSLHNKYRNRKKKMGQRMRDLCADTKHGKKKKKVTEAVNVSHAVRKDVLAKKYDDADVQKKHDEIKKAKATVDHYHADDKAIKSVDKTYSGQQSNRIQKKKLDAEHETTTNVKNLQSLLKKMKRS